MRYLLLLSILVPLHFLKTAFCQEIIFPEKDWRISTPEKQGVDSKKLNEAMAYLKQICGKHGTEQTLVIRNGYLIWAGKDIDNQHLIWSCTKSFMSTCFGLLWDDHKCTPQTNASTYLPALKKDYPTLTLEHFATFTSGYAYKNKDVLSPDTPMYKPGEKFHYSKQADTLAFILSEIAKESLSDLFTRRIAKPIGMDKAMDWKSYTTSSGKKVTGGSGHPEAGMHITARAFARFGWLYCNNGKWKDKQLISKKYIDYASVPRVPEVKPYDLKGWYIELPGSYGFNWWVNGLLPNGKRMWPSVPANTFAAQGNQNNICYIIRDWNMVIVRMGMDKIIDVKKYDTVFNLIGEGLKK